ncbi:MAG: patatin-like phospholipase family protein [Desulfocapsa sp.]|nr:patatin-like phospholipase family protein [Desulfocapsa sp.]
MAFVVSGCATLPERHPLPLDLTADAKISGIQDARFWGDEWPKFSLTTFENYSDADFRKHYSGVYNTAHNYLAISGGGSNGAFGAGLFAGWTATGTRPEFSMVTGISTGALTAPFAFLGSDYDEILKQVYTTTTTKDIVKERNLVSAAFGDSMADTTPLKELIARYISEEVVEAIAHEHQRGRRLFVGTLNLDAARSVIWNIGAIAASDHPRKRELIHTIMRASASIPVAFPPVIIPVDVAGKTYDEMHVDGGTGSQVFVYPASVDWRMITEKLKVKGTPQVYVIRNSFLDPDYRGIKRSVFPIATRSIDSLIRTQGVGDLYQIYALCKRDGNAFNLAYIPSDFTEESLEAFDPVYMKKLYQLGYDMALEGYPWKNTPPGFYNDK